MTAKIDISYRHIGQIAGPVLITNFSYTAMGVIDTIMVGRLGVTALAAVGQSNTSQSRKNSVHFWLIHSRFSCQACQSR